MPVEPTAVCAVGSTGVGRGGLAGGAGDQLAGFGVGAGGEGLDGDLVAEAFQAADVVAGAAADVRFTFVVVGAGNPLEAWTLPVSGFL